MSIPEQSPANRALQISLYNLMLALFFIVGLAMRWVYLDERPMHHDESLHAMFGKYFFDWPDHHFYKYNPMMHGPLLYNTLRLIYNAFGNSTFAARSFTALVGTILMFSPLLFRRHFSKSMFAAITAYICISPTVIYWTRFLREDILQLFAMMLMVIGVVIARDKLKGFLVILGMTLQLCIKENFFVTFAIILGYMIFEQCFIWAFKRDLRSYFANIFSYLWRFKLESLVGLGLCAALYCYLYTSGFRYSEGMLDGLGRASVSYWLNQHAIERIVGPFNFHFYVLSWYELPFILIYLFYLYAFYRRTSRTYQLIGLTIAVATALAAFSSGPRDINLQMPWKLVNVKDIYDIIGFCIFLSQAFVATIYHLARRERTLAFWGYFFCANLFSYSYLGEKVPWLAIYPFLAGLIYFGLYFDQYFKNHPIASFEQFSWSRIFVWAANVTFIFGLLFIWEEGLFKEGSAFKGTNWMFFAAALILYILAFFEMISRMFGWVNLRTLAFVVVSLFTLRLAIIINFTFAGMANEYISQVHTTPDFHRLALQIRQEILAPTSGAKPLVLGIEEAVWPLTWYMVDLPEYKFTSNEEEKKNYKYIIQDWKENQQPLEGFTAQKVPLRGWWVPDFNQMTLKKFLNYAINHRPWGDSGYSWVTVQTKKAH